MCSFKTLGSTHSIYCYSHPPVVKTSAYDGQFLEYKLPVSDADDQPLVFQLADPFTDAALSAAGVFRWRAVSNAPSLVNHESFSVSVRHQCGLPVLLRLHVDVLPCPCGNGGICRPFTDIHHSGSHIHPKFSIHLNLINVNSFYYILL